ncbi:MAG TPA: PQQ-binding-like beta-propeller repeat protein [Gaiellaceae bacterium]|nr:PQQ-binding-like beta-propeller repeat protein [Gaiellaceae bacterium]
MRQRTGLVLLAAAAALGVVAGLVRDADGARAPSANWLLFGRTADQNRYSPLTQITPGNVDGVGRVFKVDFRRLDPTVRRGEQSYPLAIDGVLYLTTNDNNVWAVNGTTGAVLWRYDPQKTAVYSNFGIVANRGVAYCAGRLFLLTLDMQIVALDRRTGRVVKQVPIAAAVPGASINYGYSETSAPVCANNRLVIGAAGSEYGVRGFVMAYKPNLTPAWANPFWTIPPDVQNWRRPSRVVGGGVVWTPTTIDTSTSTLYFGTGSPTPLYWPALRPGRNPRTNALIAVDLRTGRLKWWQQQMNGNQWSYDTAQPPMVYTARVGGTRRRVVSVATMEGVWFAYDARTGRPIYSRVKVIDRTEHPPLRPGQPVVVYPAAIGGLNYSPASFHPGRNIVVNAAAETSAILTQQRLTPTQKRRKLLLGDVFLGLEIGAFGTVNPNWKDFGSISAIDVNTGRRIWKFKTPEPERGGVTTTASGLGFAGGGDGVVRAFDLRNGRVLWTFQTSHPIAAGPTIYAVNGKEYVAITVGGTPTSSNGGTGTELHVFALGGSKAQDPPPPRGSFARERTLPPLPQRLASVLRTPAVAAAPRAARAIPSPARINAQGRLYVQAWSASSSNTPLVSGRVALRGAPVQGARVAVGPYAVPTATDASGRFRYPIAITEPRRYAARVVGAASATVRGRRLSAAQRRAVLRARGAFTVSYRLSGVRAQVQRNGTVLVSGRVARAGGGAPPPAVLYTYQLRGRLTDASGEPVRGAVVVTRTLDRDFWTQSTPTDGQGRYVSFFSASDRTEANPVPLNVQVAVGNTSYAFPAARPVRFARLRSATLDIRLPASGTTLPPAETSSYPGAVYQGMLVGVSGRNGVIRPLAARWPDARGRFSLVLPRSAQGQTLRFWQNARTFFSRTVAGPGRPVDLASWPSGLSQRVPQNLAPIRVRRR